ncbi:MAG: MOSC domain-containing protein [Halobacteriales archaeon]|nr:MOSC domain-containing protein [Halobacteriales archaeon]
MTEGTVDDIHVAPASGEPVETREAVEAVAGRGLRGDRHFHTEDRSARNRGAGLDLTLIEAEAVEAVARDFDLAFGPGEHRRNLTTRGVALNHLVGERFLVGEVLCRGVELCEPCRHLEGLTEDGAIEALLHRGGLRADVLQSGTVRVGDGIDPA